MLCDTVTLSVWLRTEQQLKILAGLALWCVWVALRTPFLFSYSYSMNKFLKRHVNCVVLEMILGGVGGLEAHLLSLSDR